MYSNLKVGMETKLLIICNMIRGAVRAGATGAVAPFDFQIYQIAPINFEDSQY